MKLEEIYEQTMKEFREGQIVKGKILQIKSKEVVIDIGYKSEGAISLEEFSNPDTLKVADEVEVFLVALEDEDGRVVISKERADRLQGWEKIVNNQKNGDVIQGKVTGKVKGGFVVDIGVDAFLPASLASLRGFINLNQLLGQTLDFMIVKINKARKNVVLSRRDILMKEKEGQKNKFFDELQVGQVSQGVVKNITDFGAFVSLGSVDGLLHITDMSWGRISHPSEMLAVGDKIEIVILDFNKEQNKVSLGLKQRTKNPWEEVGEKYPVGSKVKGKVTNIVPYGAFVELEKGVEGLVHISEVSWTKRISHANEVLAIGDVVEAVVLSINKDDQKISLGIKQTEVNPWLEIQTKYPPGTKVKAKVRSFVDYGAFLELEEGIDGLLHISDMSWTKRINHPSEVLKKAQKAEVVVLNVDVDSKKISLGLKQANPDPWPEITKKYPAGTQLEGQVVKVTNFGIFVELEKDLEGLVHVSEVDPSTPDLTAKFKPEDKIKVRVVKVDEQQRRIALSMKELS